MLHPYPTGVCGSACCAALGRRGTNETWLRRAGSARANEVSLGRNSSRDKECFGSRLLKAQVVAKV
jgi:hypothetical protein